MADKLMYIPYNDTKNHPFCSGYNVWTPKIPKVVEATNMNYKTLGTSIIMSQISPPSLVNYARMSQSNINHIFIIIHPPRKTQE